MMNNKDSELKQDYIKIKHYAPVVIPTLNRYKHFVACLESLENCTGAQFTDIYIGLDYPPSEKYEEGWNEIRKYLDHKKSSHSFKNLYVIERNYNYGLKGKQSNISQLVMFVLNSGKYDRYILSEDDNVFSPNFLDYINKGIELYKNDKRVFSICGYKNDFKCKHNENNHFAQHSLHQGWGYATWKDRHLEAQKTLTPRYFKKILYSPKKLYLCFKYWPHWTAIVYRNAMSTEALLPCHDTNLGFYLIMENKVVICPTVSKVRNMGFDSLANTTFLEHENLQGRSVYEKNLAIDTDKSFDFVGDPYLYEEDNSYSIAKWDGQWENPSLFKSLRIYVKIWIYRILNLFGIV